MTNLQLRVPRLARPEVSREDVVGHLLTLGRVADVGHHLPRVLVHDLVHHVLVVLSSEKHKNKQKKRTGPPHNKTATRSFMRIHQLLNYA